MTEFGGKRFCQFPLDRRHAGKFQVGGD